MKRQKFKRDLWQLLAKEILSDTEEKSNNWLRMHGFGPRRGAYKKYHDKVKEDVNRRRKRRIDICYGKGCY